MWALAHGAADTALFLTVNVAIDKAWTAASFDMATHQWNQYMGWHRCFWQNTGSRPRGR
ncbi:heme-binding protein [Paraburkholderia sp. EG287A]|uniref:heme-binding protein n=1 Tax=Paraburkholderia sp. EG287A TaxID=3237012 RepID=UPI0034D18211